MINALFIYQTEYFQLNVSVCTHPFKKNWAEFYRRIDEYTIAAQAHKLLLYIIIMLLYLASSFFILGVSASPVTLLNTRYLSLVWKSSNFILIVFVSRFVASPSTLLECFVRIHSFLSSIHFSQWIAIEAESNLIKNSSSFNNKCGWNFQHEKNYANNHILNARVLLCFWPRIVFAIEFQPVNNNNIEWNYVV